MKQEMITLTGKGASLGYAEGELFFYRKEKNELDASRRYQKAEEEAKLREAIARVADILEKEKERTEREVGKEEAEVFMIHRMMLEDHDLLSAIGCYLEKGHSAAYAAEQGALDLAKQLDATEDDYMKERAVDLRDIGERLVLQMVGKAREILPQDKEGVILCAEDLTPGETVLLDKKRVCAFILSGGSVNSHTAILARSMGVPAIVGVGEALFSLSEGESALVDAYRGSVTVSPDEKNLALHRESLLAYQEQKSLWEKARGKEIVTKSHHKVSLYGNVGSADEVEAVLRNDGEGVGLFRSEFLYLGRKAPPDEEEQFLAYRKALAEMRGRRVVIRTLDIGADKQVSYLGQAPEENPALGVRGIRLCFENLALFRTQLRALLRASAFGKLAILFPMIISAGEIKRAKDMLKQEAEALAKEGVAFSPTIEIGIMIETPAAALCSEALAKEVDFFSVGTNDLSQYTLAIDRQNGNASAFFDPHHEAVMKLIALAAENAHKSGIWIGICGELAADRALSERFLDMKIDELSVAPTAILPLRAHLLSLCEGKHEFEGENDV